jgi:hypothetical protein
MCKVDANLVAEGAVCCHLDDCPAVLLLHYSEVAESGSPRSCFRDPNAAAILRVVFQRSINEALRSDDSRLDHRKVALFQASLCEGSSKELKCLLATSSEDQAGRLRVEAMNDARLPRSEANFSHFRKTRKQCASKGAFLASR